MRILALDLGRRMGVADGDSSLLGRAAPTVEAVVVRGTSIENRVRWLADWLDERLSRPVDLVVTEAPMNPAASKSDHSTIDQLGYYFCLQTITSLFDIPVETASVMSVRKHFCGQASAPPVRGRKRTSKEACAAREFINEAVLKRAILLGYLPEGTTHWDEANACALWDYGCAKFARARPEALIMYGARA